MCDSRYFYTQPKKALCIMICTFPGKEGFSMPIFLKKITCMNQSELEIISRGVGVG